VASALRAAFDAVNITGDTAAQNKTAMDVRCGSKAKVNRFHI
jgi:hypothetical protein